MHIHLVVYYWLFFLLAWQQHDVQELCRVMFDALEKMFKNDKETDVGDGYTVCSVLLHVLWLFTERFD